LSARVSLVGSTGSIGSQAADVVRSAQGLFEITAIGARSSVEKLVEQANEFHPQVVAISDPACAGELASRLPSGIELRAGEGALASIATDADVIVNGVVGFAGLDVTLSALRNGRRLALANKESLVAAGPLVQHARRTPGAELLPVDSEHGALHQCLRAETPFGDSAHLDGHPWVSRLILTASGGPFRGKTKQQLGGVTVEDALEHPTWSMGPKITVDSSTLFNKGLEVIEAHELFGVDYDDIDVVIHPQSVLHSAVEFTDGSTIGQMSRPDMRLPLGYAMGYPERMTFPHGRIDWNTLGSLTFEPPDRETFRCLSLAYEAGRAGGTAPAWLNAANEVAVESFLAGRVTWNEISSIIEETLSSYDGIQPDSVEVVIGADSRARRKARQLIEQRA